MAKQLNYFKKAILPKKGKIERVAYLFDRISDVYKFIDDVTLIADNTTRVKKILDNLADANYMTNFLKKYNFGSDWYGTKDVSKFTSKPSSFLFNDKLENYLNTLKNKTVKLDKIDLDQQKSIKFTDKEIGIFSFELASLGLIPVYEYYSDYLKRKVNADYVTVEKDENGVALKDTNGDLMFYHIYKKEIPEHTIVFNASKGGYYSDLLERVVEPTEFITINVGGLELFKFLEQPEIQKHPVQRIQSVDANGQKKFTTTFKKSFIYIPRVEKPLPRIDIIVSSGFGGSIKADTEMIYASMSALAIAEKLSSSGVNYRIIMARCGKTVDDKNKEFFGYVILKKEGEALDKNIIATAISDGRFYRTTSWQFALSMQYDSGWDKYLTDTISTPINDKDFIVKNDKNLYEIISLKNGKPYGTPAFTFRTEEEAIEYGEKNKIYTNRIKDAYISMLAQSTDPSDKKASENKNSKIVFSGALSEAEAKLQYDLAIKQISKL